MDEVNNIEDEIKLLRYMSIAHYILIITSIYLNIVGINEFYYSSKIYYGFLKYSIILVIIYIIFPTSLLIIVPIFKKNLQILNILKYLTFIFIIISFIVGLLKNISVWKSSTEAENFTKYCPYHYSVELINSFIEKDKSDSKICKMRTCFLYLIDDNKPLKYSYLCNFDSSYNFENKNVGKTYKRINEVGNEIVSNLYINCNKVKNITTTDKAFEKYINLCNKNIYYKCELFEHPKDKDSTSVNNQESCPALNYGKTAFLLSISFLVIDILCFVFLFYMEYLILKKTVYMIQFSPVEIKNDNQDTINSTIKNNDNQQNNNDIENNIPEFKKEATETIIVAEMRNNEELFITPRRIKEDDTNVSQKKESKIINLKAASNVKLLNLLDGEKGDLDSNENHLEIKINNNKFNENKRNKKLKFASNQETFFQSMDTVSIPIKSPINNNLKKSKAYLNTVNSFKEQQETQKNNQNNNQSINQNNEEDEKNNNNKDGNDIHATETKRIVINKLNFEK